VELRKELLPPFHDFCCGFSSKLNYNLNRNYATEKADDCSKLVLVEIRARTQIYEISDALIDVHVS
jgi:hypothetical protein